MANGWARDGAVQDQIDDTVSDAVKAARARLPLGEGTDHCEDCGEEIPGARRKALTGSRTCVACQSKRRGRSACRDQSARQQGQPIAIGRESGFAPRKPELSL